MLYNNTNNSYIKYNSYNLLISLISLLFFISCKQKNTGNNTLTPDFKKIADSVDRYSDTNPALAVKYLDSAYTTVKKPNFSDDFKRLSYHFILSGKYQHNYKQSLIYADSMLDAANQNGGQQNNPSLFAEANFAKGDAYFDLHNYASAYKCYFNGYNTGKSNLNNMLISDYAYRMGMITYLQEHYSLSIQYFKDSYHLNLPNDSKFVAFYRNQEVLDNVALAFRNLNKPDSALYYFDKTIEYINKHASNFNSKANLLEVARAVVYGNEANIYIKRKQYPAAIDLLKKSMNINLQKGNDGYDALQSEIKLADIYAEQKQQALLMPLLNNIATQLKNINNKHAESEWYRLMSDYYAGKNQLVLALNYNRHYNTLKDSLLETKRLLKESNVSEQISNYEKEHEIQNLTNNNKLQRTLLIAAILFAVMALVIILLIYRNWKRSKNELVVVSILNSQVNKQKINLETALHKLHKSSQEKDRILHTVAHDLRNPLGGISSLTNVMKADDDYTTEQQEYVNIIKETADNSLELINEIFEATDSAITETKLKPVDINVLLNNSVELLRFKAAEKNQQIALNVLLSPEKISISKEKIWRVISNLIINAIKFSPVGATIKVDAKKYEHTICIAVTDNGIGIPEEMKPKVFNMFTEAKRPGTMGEKSFGLGLSICKQIIEKHNGKIWFESNAGGTTFYVSLNRGNVD